MRFRTPPDRSDSIREILKAFKSESRAGSWPLRFYLKTQSGLAPHMIDPVARPSSATSNARRGVRNSYLCWPSRKGSSITTTTTTTNGVARQSFRRRNTPSMSFWRYCRPSPSRLVWLASGSSNIPEQLLHGWSGVHQQSNRGFSFQRVLARSPPPPPPPPPPPSPIRAAGNECSTAEVPRTDSPLDRTANVSLSGCHVVPTPRHLDLNADS